jgi:tRNA(Ile)-lysidine synthase
MDKFETAVLQTVNRHAMLRDENLVVVALSGGPDSVALLRALKALAEELGVEITAAHANHGLRGEESDADEKFVRDLCSDLAVPLIAEHLPIDPVRQQRNLEAHLRELRYDFLIATASDLGGSVATGHSQNDQAETLLLKLIRGSGPTGQASIFPVRCEGQGGEIRIIRPLIESSREEILSYLERMKAGFREDRSNWDLELDRNWVRHELIPILQKRLNPRVVETLAQTAGVSRLLGQFLESQGEEALEACLVGGSDLSIDVEKALGLPDAVRSEIIRQGLKRVRGDLDGITFRHIEDVKGLLAKTSGCRADLPGDWQAVRHFGILRLNRSGDSPDFENKLTVPGEVYVKEIGKRVRVRRAVDSDPDDGLLRLPTEAVVVRNWQPGDRFERRLGHPRRLKRFFAEQRIPVERRRQLVLLESEGKIVWVEEVGPSEGFSVDRRQLDGFVVEVI